MELVSIVAVLVFYFFAQNWQSINFQTVYYFTKEIPITPNIWYRSKI